MVDELDTREGAETERRQRRRRAIVETAARLFAQLGYSDCEMERLAGELGIAKGTLYLYFPGKQELFFACVDWGMRLLQDAVRGAAATTHDPLQGIALAVRAYLAFFDSHPEYVELLIQERAIFKDRKRPTYFEYRDANRGYWRDLYCQLIQEGRIRGDLPVERIMDSVGSLVYGAMFTNHFAGRSVPFDEQCTAILETIFRGILTEAERSQLTTLVPPAVVPPTPPRPVCTSPVLDIPQTHPEQPDALKPDTPFRNDLAKSP